jgi:hypothetical protein
LYFTPAHRLSGKILTIIIAQKDKLFHPLARAAVFSAKSARTVESLSRPGALF